MQKGLIGSANLLNFIVKYRYCMCKSYCERFITLYFIGRANIALTIQVTKN